MILNVKIEVDCIDPQRIDQFLVTRLPELSRSRIQTLIKSGDILLNEEISKAKQQVRSGDQISVSIPEEESFEAQPEDIPLKYSMRMMTLLCLTKLMAWWFILQQAIQTAP